MISAEFERVLVTGAAGFIGACAARELSRRGHAVHTLLRTPSRAWRLDGILDCIHVHEGDLTDADRVTEIVRDVRPAAIVHLATHGAYERQADARSIFHTNLIGTYNLLEAARDCGVRAFANAGSSSEYGFRAEPMRESDRVQPNSFYAVAKAAQTHLASLISARSELGVCTFRLFSIYGPWEEPTRLIPTIIRRAWSGLPLEMVSPNTSRDFVYVDDILVPMLDFERIAKMKGDVVNLGTGVQTSLEQVIETLRSVCPRPLDVRWGAMQARHWDADKWVSDPSRAKELFHWTAEHSLRDGLARTADWIQQQGGGDGDELKRCA